MSDTNRKLLCRSGGTFTTDAVYQTADGLEVDSSEHYEIVRRRVLYDDVQLVTYHSERGVGYLVLTGLWAALFLTAGISLLMASLQSWPGAMVFLAIGAPPMLMFLARLVFGRDAITVFGRRSKAVLRFSGARRARTRELYDRICADVRRVQAAAAEEPQPQSPLPPDVPMPPA
jgi:hypothetical protein